MVVVVVVVFCCLCDGGAADGAAGGTSGCAGAVAVFARLCSPCSHLQLPVLCETVLCSVVIVAGYACCVRLDSAKELVRLAMACHERTGTSQDYVAVPLYLCQAEIARIDGAEELNEATKQSSRWAVSCWLMTDRDIVRRAPWSP